MAPEKKKSDQGEGSKTKAPRTPKPDVDEVDLGDADGSSSHSGMDNFKLKQSDEYPNNIGRIDDL